MIRRRTFLGFLATVVTALLGAAGGAHASGGKPEVRHDKPKLIIHKGWILRADDLQP